MGLPLLHPTPLLVVRFRTENRLRNPPIDSLDPYTSETRWKGSLHSVLRERYFFQWSTEPCEAAHSEGDQYIEHNKWEWSLDTTSNSDCDSTNGQQARNEHLR